MAVDSVRKAIEAGNGPTGAGDFVALQADALIDRIGPVITELDDQIHAVEQDIVDERTEGIRHRLAHLRREAIGLRRYIAPERDAMKRLSNQSVDWLKRADRVRLREVADRLVRNIENLDAARERAQVAQDELASRLSEQANNNMYVLSVVVAIFLPPGYITGLLGVNVAGMPGTKWPWAFAAVTAGLAALGVIEVWLFRRLKWF